jgi:hypothetical protein
MDSEMNKYFFIIGAALLLYYASKKQPIVSAAALPSISSAGPSGDLPTPDMIRNWLIIVASRQEQYDFVQTAPSMLKAQVNWSAPAELGPPGAGTDWSAGVPSNLQAEIVAAWTYPGAPGALAKIAHESFLAPPIPMPHIKENTFWTYGDVPPIPPEDSSAIIPKSVKSVSGSHMPGAGDLPLDLISGIHHLKTYAI